MSAKLAHVLQGAAACIAIMLGAQQLGLMPAPVEFLPVALRPSPTWWPGKYLGRPQPKAQQQAANQRKMDTRHIKQIGPDGTRLLNHEGNW